MSRATCRARGSVGSSGRVPLPVGSGCGCACRSGSPVDPRRPRRPRPSPRNAGTTASAWSGRSRAADAPASGSSRGRLPSAAEKVPGTRRLEKLPGFQNLKTVALAPGTQGAPRSVRRHSSPLCAGPVGWRPGVLAAAPPVGGCQLADPPPDRPRKAGFHRGWWAGGGSATATQDWQTPRYAPGPTARCRLCSCSLFPAQRNATIHRKPVALPRKVAHRRPALAALARRGGQAVTRGSETPTHRPRTEGFLLLAFVELADMIPPLLLGQICVNTPLVDKAIAGFLRRQAVPCLRFRRPRTAFFPNASVDVPGAPIATARNDVGVSARSAQDLAPP